MTGTPPDVSIAHLQAATSKTTESLAARVVAVLAAIPADAEVFWYPVPADSFAGAVRKRSAKDEPGLRSFIGALDALGNELVLIGQVSHNDDLLTVVLRASDRALVSATVIDKSAGAGHITVRELCTRLRASDAPGTALALEVAVQCSTDERLRIFEQGALSTARTFLTKYTRAAEKGFDVRGLEEFARALVPLGEEQPGFCILRVDTTIATTVFGPGTTDPLAAMRVGRLPPRPARRSW